MSDILERLPMLADELDNSVDDWQPEVADVLREAAAEIERLRSLVAREGWKLVPVEPAEAQLAAIADAVLSKPAIAPIPWHTGYTIMVEAAPTPPAPRTSGETSGE